MKFINLSNLFKCLAFVTSTFQCLNSSANDFNITITNTYPAIDLSNVKYIDKENNGLWQNSQSSFSRGPTIAIKTERSDSFGFEYRNNTFHFSHEGRFGQLTCAFFGCSYVSSKILGNADGSDIAKLNLNSHSIFLTNLTPQNRTINDFALSLGFISTNTELLGFETPVNYQRVRLDFGKIPTVGFRLKHTQDLSDSVRLYLKITPTFFMSKEGNIFFVDLDVFSLISIGKNVSVGFGLLASHYRLRYSNPVYYFHQMSNHINPSIQIDFKF
jgi:hypothetical protein